MSHLNNRDQKKESRIFCRSMEREDISLGYLSHLHDLCLPIKYPTKFYESLLKPGRVCILCFDNSSNDLVGCVSGCAKKPKRSCFSFISTGENNSSFRGYIMTLCVHPSYRCLGYGKLLMKEITFIFSRLGVEYIYLHVQTENTDALRLYKNFGFYISKICNEYYYYTDQYHDAYEMTFDIPTNERGEKILLVTDNIDHYVKRSNKKDVTPDFTLISKTTNPLIYFLPLIIFFFLISFIYLLKG